MSEHKSDVLIFTQIEKVWPVLEPALKIGDATNIYFLVQIYDLEWSWLELDNPRILQDQNNTLFLRDFLSRPHFQNLCLILVTFAG